MTTQTQRQMTDKLERAVGEVRKVTSGKSEHYELAISSELPYERWFGIEVLEHSAEAVDLSRVASGIPALVNHDTGDQIGIMDSIRLDTDKVLRGRMRFGRSARAKEIQQDVDDGIRRCISVGYRVTEWLEAKGSGNAPSVFTAKRWTPLEVSVVPVPADPTVGFGREDRETEVTRTIRHGEKRMYTTAEGPTGMVNFTDANTSAARVAQLATVHGFADRLPAWLAAGRSPESVAAEILDLKRTQVQPSATIMDLDMSPRERQPLSLCKAIVAAGTGDWRQAGFERAMSEAVAKKLGRDTGGFFFPTGYSTRAAGQLDTATAAQGQKLVYTESGPFIDLFRAKLSVRQLGAQLLSGLQGNVAIPRQIGAGTATWVGEAPAVGVALSNLTTDQVPLTPKTLQSATTYSRQLLVQSTPGVEMLVKADMAALHARAVDLAAISGSGAANQPLGIWNQTGVGTVAFGGTVTYAKAVDMQTAVVNANAELDSMGYVTSPTVRGKAMQTQIFAGTNGAPLWVSTGSAENEQMAGYRAVATNQTRQNLGAGTNEHEILYGNWAELFVGEWGAFEVIVDGLTLADRGLYKVVSIQMVDVALRHGASFCKGTGLIP